MERRTVWIVVVAVVALTVIALSAATLDSTTDAGGGVGLGGSDQGLDDERTERPEDLGGGGDGGSVGALPEPGFPVDIPLPCFRLLMDPLVIFGLIAAIFLIGALIAWRWTIGEGVAIVMLIVIIGLPIYLLLTACEVRDVDIDFPLVGGSPGGEGGGLNLPGVTDSTANPTPPEILFILGGLLAFVALLAWWASGDRDLPSEPEEETDEPIEPSPDVAAVGRAAGRAADRLETTDEFENEVYRAWAEMTRSIDVAHPRSSTPAEFASAAVEAGMEPPDVNRLTVLFEEVRYGGFDATPERERDAIETLRRIEEQYAEWDAEG